VGEDKTPSKVVVGMTGGIASGKSSVARELTARGVVVVDADQLAREVVKKGSAGLAEIVKAFGADVLTAAGELDRERLGARVFQNADARKILNGITHPRIAQLSAERIAAALQTSAPYVVYDAALLVETGAHRGLAALIVVAAEPQLQVERLMARDGLSLEAARSRLAAQAPLEAKLAAADYIIRNDGSREQLAAQVEHLHQQLLQRFGTKP
jgi:dephospho-CoA kinase